MSFDSGRSAVFSSLRLEAMYCFTPTPVIELRRGEMLKRQRIGELQLADDFVSDGERFLLACSVCLAKAIIGGFGLAEKH
jgi:hypothetical protein